MDWQALWRFGPPAILTFLSILTPAPPAMAQGQEPDSLLRKLEQLEERQAALEAENQRLRERLERLEAADLAEREAPSAQAPPLRPGSAPQGVASPAAPSGEAPAQRVEMGAEIRFRPETRGDFNEKNALNSFLLQRIRLHARLRLNQNTTGLVQIQDSRLWGQEISTASNESNLDLHQAYLQVNRFLFPQLTLRLGRQELIYGTERLVGAFGWDNVGRSFDALKLTYAAGRWSSDFFFSRVADRRNSNRGDGSQDLIGLYNRIATSDTRFGLEPYLLYLRDGLEIRGERSGVSAESTRLLTLGFRHFAGFKSGFSYEAENAYQVGQNGPDAHRAAAVAARANYRWSRRGSPEIGLEYDFATGDGDPQDGRSGEFNNLFPTNHVLYGYADYLGWRNMQDFKPYVAFQPWPNGRAELSYHRFRLTEERGPWKNAGGKVLGFDPTGRLGTDLGHELDLILTFPLYEQVRILSGYSVFFPGRFARATQGPQASQFGYLQTLVSF